MRWVQSTSTLAEPRGNALTLCLITRSIPSDLSASGDRTSYNIYSVVNVPDVSALGVHASHFIA
jgi:hypothetical protein